MGQKPSRTGRNVSLLKARGADMAQGLSWASRVLDSLGVQGSYQHVCPSSSLPSLMETCFLPSPPGPAAPEVDGPREHL